MIELQCLIGGEEALSNEIMFIRGVYGETLATIPDLGKYSLVRAVRAARASKSELNELTCESICNIFAKAATTYDERFDDVIALSRGNTVQQVRAGRTKVKKLLLNFESVIDQAFGKSFAQTKNPCPNDRKHFYEPLGVVAIFPSSTTREVAPHAILSALAVGNPVIVKVDTKEPFSALELAYHLYSAGLPRGALSILSWNTEEKPELGPRLVELAEKSVLFGFDETIKKVAYSALSEQVGGDVVAKLPIPNNIVAFGTGRSKSILFDCQDIDRAAKMVAKSATIIPSACLKTQFIVVESSIKDDFTEAYSRAVTKLHTGALLDVGTDVGHTMPRNRKMVDQVIKNAVAFGAKKVIGDNIYTEPCLFDDVHPEALMAKEEVPAPCLGIIDAGTLSDAISLVNDSVRFTSSRKSLCVSVYTRSDKVYEACIKRINAFSVLHNRPTTYVDVFGPHQGLFLCRELTTLKVG